ncbi:MAG: AAA family ATPase [Candidatus Binatia bacterium]
MAKPTRKSPRRKSPTTEREIITPDDFAAEIRELDGNSESANFLFYGDPDSGKTTLIGSAARSLILACEPGYISASRYWQRQGIDVGPRKIRIVNNSAMLLAGLDWLEGGGWKKFKWVILEGATSLESRVRLGYAAEAFDANPAKRVHRNLPDKPDYFNTQNYLRGVIPRLVDLPVNTIVTAHAMRLTDDDGNRIVMPSFQQSDGALSNFVCGMMHVVGHMKKVRNKKEKRLTRRILFSERIDPDSGTRYVAKDQFDVLPRIMTDTSMPEIMKHIGKNEET